MMIELAGIRRRTNADALSSTASRRKKRKAARDHREAIPIAGNDVRSGGRISAADLLFDAIEAEVVDYAGAIPIVAAVCARSWSVKPVKGFFVRNDVKGHGTDRRIDGLIERGARVILFEDVTTTGGADRLEGAKENFRAAGIKFHSLFTWRDFS